MTENTQAIDIVQSTPDVQDVVREILAATFGPNTAAEVAAVEATPSAGSSSVEDDGAVVPTDLPSGKSEDTLPAWWKFNLDGTPRKKCQAPDVLKGVPHGETRQRETDLLVLKALHEGCETLVELVAHTTFVKVTVVRSLERLVKAGRVVQSKAAPSGKRGRPAFVYRPTTEAVEASG